jgi:hypothetical protein
MVAASAPERFSAGLLASISSSPGSFLVSREADSEALSHCAKALSDLIELSTVVFSRLRANCTLVRRDQMLAASNLSSDDQQTLRGLPISDASLFGPCLGPFLADRASSASQDALVSLAKRAEASQKPQSSQGKKRKASMPSQSSAAKQPRVEAQPRPEQRQVAQTSNGLRVNFVRNKKSKHSGSKASKPSPQ